MKICPNCGKELADDVKFCEKCGFSLDTASQNQTGDQNAAPQDANGAQMQQGFNQNGSFSMWSLIPRIILQSMMHAILPIISYLRYLHIQA